jgi:prolyl oligopeptidase
MIRHPFAQFLATLLLATSPALPQAAEPVQTSSNSNELHALFDAEWQRGLREDPIRASYVGDARYDHQWPDVSLEAVARSNAADRAALAALDRMDPQSLDEADRLNEELFRRQLSASLDSYAYGAQLLPLNQRSRLSTLHRVAELIDFRTMPAYDRWHARLNTIDRYVDQNIALMREGVRRGLVPPKVILQRVPAQLDRQLVADPEQSPFYGVFRSMPATFSPEDRARLQSAARAAIKDKVIPSYRRLKQFVDQEYLPKCRDSVGVWDTPNGDARYAQLARFYTTTDLKPDQIHEIGLKEVARIRAQMLTVIAKTGFQGSFDEFLKYLRTDPKFRYTDSQQLFTAYAAMAKRIDPLLPQYFGKLPRMPYGVRAIAPEVAPDTTTAYYEGPSLDGRRAGYYYVNLYKPEERPKYEIPVLTVHEAVPGHHLQIALASEMGELPEFRRDFEATAFVEGWGLYSESLGQEMGLYDDPYDKFGQLTYEMWRAVRLVVDTGLHAKHWSRQQAIDYFKSNAAKTELDIVNEVDRYISTPGQALAYKIGELRIKELRQQATTALGPSFDLRAFHDVVLGSGAVPLDVLSANVQAWIRHVQAAPAATGR